MEIKQHTSEQPIGQRGNKMEIKNILKQMEIKTQLTKTYEMQQSTSKRYIFLQQ